MNWKGYAIVLLSVSLCACAAAPHRECPQPNPDLLRPLPPEGWATKALDEAIKKGQTSPRTSTP